MRHLSFGKKLSRDTKSRKALLANLANSLIIEGRVTTTLAKAKFAKPYVEKLVTQVKNDKLHKRRKLAAILTSKALKQLLELKTKFDERNGGYTRIVKQNPRRGDSAKMARLEFIKWEKSKSKESKTQKGKKKKSIKEESSKG